LLSRDPKALSPVLRYNTVNYGMISQSASEKELAALFEEKDE
jgi:hypothetical protein